MSVADDTVSYEIQLCNLYMDDLYKTCTNIFVLGLGRVLKNGTEYSPSDNRPEVVPTIRSLL